MCWFLLCHNGNRSWVYTYISPPSWASLPPPPLVVTECRAGLPVLYSSFPLSLIFNRRIIAFQCCVGFCRTTVWISHKYTYVPSLLKPRPACPRVPPLSVVTGHRVELPVLHGSFSLAVLCMIVPCILGCWRFVSVLKLRSMNPPSLFFTFKIVWGPLYFHMNFQINLPISAKRKTKQNKNFRGKTIQVGFW